jgi:hypothetical protein
MGTRRQFVAWVHVVVGCALVAGVAALWIAAALLAPLFEGSFVPELVAMFGRPIAIGLLVFGTLEVAAAWGLLRGQRWARRVLFVVALLQFSLVPVGTAIAVVTWWAIAMPGPARATPEA